MHVGAGGTVGQPESAAAHWLPASPRVTRSAPCSRPLRAERMVDRKWFSRFFPPPGRRGEQRSPPCGQALVLTIAFPIIMTDGTPVQTHISSEVTHL